MLGSVSLAVRHCKNGLEEKKKTSYIEKQGNITSFFFKILLSQQQTGERDGDTKSYPWQHHHCTYDYGSEPTPIYYSMDSIIFGIQILIHRHCHLPTKIKTGIKTGTKTCCGTRKLRCRPVHLHLVQHRCTPSFPSTWPCISASCQCGSIPLEWV